MAKKRVVGIILAVSLLVIAVAVTSVIIAAAQSQKYQSITYGHGGDQVWVDTPGGLAELDAVLSQLVVVKNQVLPGTPTNPGTSTPATSADFIVRVDSGEGISSLDACPSGYEWIGHIHGRIPSGTAMDSSSDPAGLRQTRDGWFSLCLRSPDRAQKDITTVISANSCNPSQIDASSCPSGYTQIGSFTRTTSNCATEEPQLGSDTTRSNLAVNGGTLLICQKGMPEYFVRTTTSCGADTMLGRLISGSNSGTLHSFCKSAGTTTSVQDPNAPGRAGEQLRSGDGRICENPTDISTQFLGTAANYPNFYDDWVAGGKIWINNGGKDNPTVWVKNYGYAQMYCRFGCTSGWSNLRQVVVTCSPGSTTTTTTPTDYQDAQVR